MKKWKVPFFFAGQIATNFGLYEGRMFSIDDPVATGFGHAHSHGAGAFDGRGGSFVGLGGQGGWGPGIGGGHSLPRCPAVVCPMHFISPRCSYTPVMRTTFGTYCLGCAEDICGLTDDTLRPRQGRRRRRIRRRLCRQFGICTWNGGAGSQFLTPRF